MIRVNYTILEIPSLNFSSKTHTAHFPNYAEGLVALQGQLLYKGSSLLHLTILTSAHASSMSLRQRKKDLAGGVLALKFSSPYCSIFTQNPLARTGQSGPLFCKGLGNAAEHVYIHGAVSATSTIPNRFYFPRMVKAIRSCMLQML